MEAEDGSKVPSDSSSDSGDWQQSMQENWSRVFSSSSKLCQPWRLYLAFRGMKIVTTEPVLFLFMFGLLMYSSMIEQYYLKRFGLEKLRHNTSFPFPNGSESFCINSSQLDKYGGNGTSDDVQASSSHLFLYGMVPNQLLSVIAALTFGPLSDRFGRRPPMVLIGIGATLNGLMSVGIMHFELNLKYFILSNAIAGLCGGFAGVISLSFSYIADISSLKWRTLRISILESMIFAGGALGDGISGYWLNELNCYFEPIIWLYTAANALIIVYVLLFLPEPLTRRERLENAKNRPRGCKSTLQGFKIFFCSPWWLTWRLWVSLVALFVFVMNISGSNEITTLFLRNEPLDWNPKIIGIYQSTFQASHMVALLVILPILVALKFPDALIGLIGLAFNCGMNVFTGFVRQSWQMFVIGAVIGVEAAVPPIFRSIMSKLVPAEDQGALFSFIGAASVLAAASGTAVYNSVYPAALEHGLSSGTAYFLMALLCTIPAPAIILLLIFRKLPHHAKPNNTDGLVSQASPTLQKARHGTTTDSREVERLDEPTEREVLSPDAYSGSTYGSNDHFTSSTIN